jgi:hypothetical protein
VEFYTRLGDDGQVVVRRGGVAWTKCGSGEFERQVSYGTALVQRCWKCWGKLTTDYVQVLRSRDTVEQMSNQGMFSGCQTCDHGVIRVVRRDASRYLFFASPGWALPVGLAERVEVYREGKWVFCRTSPAGAVGLAEELNTAQSDAALVNLMNCRYRDRAYVATTCRNLIGQVLVKYRQVPADTLYTDGCRDEDVLVKADADGRVLVVLPGAMFERRTPSLGDIKGSDEYRRWWTAVYGGYSASLGLGARVQELLAAGWFAPFIKPPVDRSGEVNEVLGAMGKEKGLTLEGVKRLYARL